MRYVALPHAGRTSRRYGLPVVGTLRSASQRTAYLVRCRAEANGPIHEIEMASGDSTPTSPGYGQDSACVHHAHRIIVRAGATRVDTLAFAGPNSPNDAHPLRGGMRVRYRIQPCLRAEDRPGGRWVRRSSRCEIAPGGQ